MNLRDQIINEMKRRKKANPARYNLYPTWWFKFEIPEETAVIRKELERMERDGIVKKSPTSRRGQAEWVLL